MKHIQTREEILWLAKNTNKPFFVIGRMEPILDPNQNHVSFSHVRPYAWGCSTYYLCHHINLPIAEVEKYVKINFDNFGKSFFICVRPHIYYGEDGTERGGLSIDTSIIKEAIFEKFLQKYNFTPIPQDKYLDFRKILDGKFIREEIIGEDKRPKPHRYRGRHMSEANKRIEMDKIISDRRRRQNKGKLSKKARRKMMDKVKWKTMAEADKEREMAQNKTYDTEEQ